MEKRVDNRASTSTGIRGSSQVCNGGEIKTIQFRVVTEQLRSKPRMTRRDIWKKRPIVERWYAYKDLIAISYRQAGGKTFMGPVNIDYQFYLSNKRRIDSDNLIKGINDALIGLAFPDDKVAYIRGGSFEITFIPKGLSEEALITIKPRI